MQAASKFPLWHASINASSKHVSVMSRVDVSSRRPFSSCEFFPAALIISISTKVINLRFRSVFLENYYLFEDKEYFCYVKCYGNNDVSKWRIFWL